MNILKNIKTYKLGDKVALHKPLLLLYLFGKVINEKTKTFDYYTVKNEASSLFNSFGVSDRINYPYWRLKNDNLLSFPYESQIHVYKNGDALIEDLKKYGESTFSNELWMIFNNPEDLKIHIKYLLDEYFSESWHEELLHATGLDKLYIVSKSLLKKRNPLFRKNVAIAYNYQCAICGFNITLSGTNIINEAAHIKWHAYNEPDIIENGVLLCPVHHKLFDRGLFSIKKDFTIEISTKTSELGVCIDNLFYQYKNKEIFLPRNEQDRPLNEYLDWHYDNIFIN